MSEKIEKLVRMANQIADFFTPYSEAERIAGVKEHIRSFWTPRMREELLAFADAGGKGRFMLTDFVPTEERTGARFPLLLTTGRILSQYNVGAQTRRTANTVWHTEDRLELHPHDAEQRGIVDGSWVKLSSRAGATSLRAQVTDRVAPGVVYTTFHHPTTQANVVTSDYSDWATNCPEYKVTAVQVSPSNGPSEWQREYAEQAKLGTGRKVHKSIMCFMCLLWLHIN